MGIELCIIFETGYDKDTGLPYETNIPKVPVEYRVALSKKGGCWTQFIQDEFQGRTDVHDFVSYLPEWEDVEEKQDLTEEEYTEWKNALEWFADYSCFYVTWWY